MHNNSLSLLRSSTHESLCVKSYAILMAVFMKFLLFWFFPIFSPLCHAKISGCYSFLYLPSVTETVHLLSLIQVENDSIYTTCFQIFWILILENLVYNAMQIGWKFTEQWLPKAKISGPVNDRRPDFEKCIDLKHPYCFTKVHWRVRFLEILRDTIVLLIYQVS